MITLLNEIYEQTKKNIVTLQKMSSLKMTENQKEALGNAEDGLRWWNYTLLTSAIKKFEDKTDG